MKRGVVFLMLLIPVLLLSGFGYGRPMLEDWESAAELVEFLEEDKTDERVYLWAGGDGKIRLGGGQCEDQALRLILNAEAQGKRLHFVPINGTEYRKWYGGRTGYNRYHVVVGALVDNSEFWYIEPSDDRCWRALFLD